MMMMVILYVFAIHSVMIQVLLAITLLSYQLSVTSLFEVSVTHAVIPHFPRQYMVLEAMSMRCIYYISLVCVGYSFKNIQQSIVLKAIHISLSSDLSCLVQMMMHPLCIIYI